MADSFRTFEAFEEALAKFSTLYDMESIVLCPQESMVRGLKPKNERTCRFCGLQMPDTRFEKVPHIISELLGNKYLVSDFECDTCNEFFSVYENDLANFLGPLRTIHNVQAKDKVPTFKSVGREIEARKEGFYGVKNGIKIARIGANKESFRRNPETGALEITYTKHAYSPIKVYKALLKIALSVLPTEHVPNYRRLTRLLLEDNEHKLAYFAHVAVTYSPYVATVPWCYIFKKRALAFDAPMHVVSLYFQSYIFEIHVPLHEQDIALRFYQGRDITFHQCPPLYVIDLNESLAQSCIVGWRDFTGTEPIQEQERLTLNMAVDSLKNTQVYNPATGETTQFTDAWPDIVKVYMSRSGELPDFPKGPFPA
jgi:hypothetical protein